MNDKVEKLIKKEEEIEERFSIANNAAETLRQMPKTDRFLEYPILLGILEKKADHLKNMQMKVWARIEKEQNKCKHEYPDGKDAHTKWRGNDHNWSYYTCVFCNHEEKQ